MLEGMVFALLKAMRDDLGARLDLFRSNRTDILWGRGRRTLRVGFGLRRWACRDGL